MITTGSASRFVLGEQSAPPPSGAGLGGAGLGGSRLRGGPRAAAPWLAPDRRDTDLLTDGVAGPRLTFSLTSFSKIITFSPLINKYLFFISVYVAGCGSGSPGGPAFP